MIKFFRKIRQQLLTPAPEGTRSVRAGNKVSKYLLYAIGEIVLVMIGILLALQVNNWNENRKKNQLAQKYLQTLYMDFIQNDVLVDHALEQMEGTKQATRSLAVFIDSGLVEIDKKNRILLFEEFHDNYKFYENDYIPIYDSISLIYNLNRAGWVTSYDLILPGWGELISTGNIQLIENKNLKDEIVMLHLLAGEIKELETKIMTPIVKDFKTIRAAYYDVSKSVAGPLESNEPGLFNDDDLVDILALRSKKEIRDQLRLVYRAANEQQDNIRGNIGRQASIIIDLLKNELSKLGLKLEEMEIPLGK